MRRLIIIFVIFSIAFNAYSTHIVGGEFQLIEQRGGLYDIYLNLYFDVKYGTPAAKDNSFTASIYQKSNNVWKADLNFFLISEEEVVYENIDCKIPQVETSKITYATKTSDGEVGFQFTTDYSDPEGYYIVWDRCCRNDSIVNIVDPDLSGMLFYLHFPPIFDNSGDLTGWSSPAFETIPGTYACLDQPFELDFGATDIDGDSLYYSMNEPLIGHSSDLDPKPSFTSPAPYPIVTWEVGHDIDNQITGNPSLSINPNTGMLTVTPSQKGLHVFSIKCEEFRNGIKIGEVYRDFQIYVYDGCTPNIAPQTNMLLPDSTYYNEGDTIVIQSSEYDCMDLEITDNLDNRNGEKISVSVVPVNFNTSINMVNKGDDEFVNGIGDTLRGWQICPPTCEDYVGEPYVFDIVVADNGCPKGEKDTTRVVVDLLVEENQKPILTNSYSVDSIIDIEIFEIDTININFTGYDADSSNLISLKVIPDQFSLDDYGMSFNDTSLVGSSISSEFEWIINCEKLEGSNRENFRMWFVLNDNSCGTKGYDTIEVNITINYEVVSEDFEIFNVFTPNGDGLNEFFTVKGLPRDNCENQYVSFEIYNRWGRKIYENPSRTIKWDGDQISDGVYYYIARYTNHSYKGHFTVLR